VIDYYDRSGKRQRYTLKDIKTKKNAELAFAQFSLKYERQEIDLPTEDDLTLEKAIEALIENRRLSDVPHHGLPACAIAVIIYLNTSAKSAGLLI